MSLETPDRIRASAVLLIQNFFTPGEETVEFASNNGFSSVSLIFDAFDFPVGALLPMDQPVNNQEGAVTVGGDRSVVPGDLGYITPNHFLVGEPEFDDLEPFQCVAVFQASQAVFRLYVTVLAMTAVPLSDETKAAIAGEPLAP